MFLSSPKCTRGFPGWAPSSRTSGTEPFSKATTGVPQAMASIITRPKGSRHAMGNNSPAALPRNSSGRVCKSRLAAAGRKHRQHVFVLLLFNVGIVSQEFQALVGGHGPRE
jgi:hypothetical protein